MDSAITGAPMNWALLGRPGCGVLELSRERRGVSYIYRYGVSNAGLVGGLKPSYDRVKPVCRYSEDHLLVLHHRPDPVAISRQHYLRLPGLECLQDSFSAGPAPATEHGLHSYTSFLGD